MKFLVLVLLSGFGVQLVSYAFQPIVARESFARRANRPWVHEDHRLASLSQGTVAGSTHQIGRFAVERLSASAFKLRDAVLSHQITSTLKKIISNNKVYILLLCGVATALKARFWWFPASKGARMECGWWKRGTGSSLARTTEFWTFAVSFFVQYSRLQQIKHSNSLSYSNRLRKLGKLLTIKLLDLGPTFIKFGQLLSTRVDVLPREFIQELVALQDQVPSFSGDTAVEIIESEFGKPITDVFDYFNRTAFAAASLGQVHVAFKDGKKLAVKVQRQGLRELFDSDLRNLKAIAKLLDWLDPKNDGTVRDWSSIYDESARLLYQEIDYVAEAYNAVRFQSNFHDVPWVKVPDVYLNLTSTRVLTMEYVAGTKINDIDEINRKGLNKQLLAKRSAESYLMQLCRHGFFHCDPHPGNVACDGEQGGRLIYYDFGMMDELKPHVKKGLVDLIFGVYENDVKAVCEALESIDVLRHGVDRVSVERIIRTFLQEFSCGLKPGARWISQMSSSEQKDIEIDRRRRLGGDLFSVSQDAPFFFPPMFAFVLRSFMSLDGVGKGLDPDYDLTRLAQPFLKELVDLRSGSSVMTLIGFIGKQLGLRPVDLQNMLTQSRKIASVESILTRMEQGDLKVRVRVLESELAFKKLEVQNRNLALAVAAILCVNLGATLAQSTRPWPVAAYASYIAAAACVLQIPAGWLKLRTLKQFESKQ